MDHDVAYKLALIREFQTLASLHHPNVIRVLSYGFDGHRGPYYTMELWDAPKTLLEATRDKSDTEKAALLAQLLRALAYVHRRGILHRVDLWRGLTDETCESGLDGQGC